jgi:hypothetical protein
LPHAFDGVYPEGNLSWHHLWFLAYVLVLTLVLLPVFLWARSASGRATVALVGRLAARFGLHWAMVLPLATSTLWLAPISWNINGLVGDWHGIRLVRRAVAVRGLHFRVARSAGGAGTPALLLAGGRRPRLRVSLRRIFRRNGPADHPARSPTAPSHSSPAINVMAWLFAIIGFARRHLTRRPAFLAEATEAVYPFYLIHQTVTVGAVYALLKIGAPPLAGVRRCRRGDVRRDLVASWARC